MIDLGTRVYVRLAEGAQSPNTDRIHVAMITKNHTETKVNLKVFPDMAAITDMAEVEMQGSEAEAAACWSPWIESLQPSA
jgi:hypothetical protein